MKLAGKVALITGAGSGLGREIAHYFARDGAKIVINDVNMANAEKVVGEVKELGSTAIAIKADVSDSGQVCEMFEQAIKEFGTLDILVNNAGIGGGGAGSTINTSDELWHRMMAVHLTGSFYCTREALKIMEQKSSGCIIYMSSLAGAAGLAGSPSYSAAKAGMLGLMKCVTKEFAAKGIRANAIAPTFIDTPFLGNIKEDPARLQRLSSQIPMGRLGKPNEVASLVAYLATDDAMMITGQVISPGGGHFV